MLKLRSVWNCQCLHCSQSNQNTAVQMQLRPHLCPHAEFPPCRGKTIRSLLHICLKMIPNCHWTFVFSTQHFPACVFLNTILQPHTHTHHTWCYTHKAHKATGQHASTQKKYVSAHDHTVLTCMYTNYNVHE